MLPRGNLSAKIIGLKGDMAKKQY